MRDRGFEERRRVDHARGRDERVKAAPGGAGFTERANDRLLVGNSDVGLAGLLNPQEVGANSSAPSSGRHVEHADGRNP
ncbi:MAG TPA: hypothetical protein VFB99_06215, partial [Vicinamibacterales bacterium]|nr:hypothetical protein [Vicinamibacterales bacterium]